MCEDKEYPLTIAVPTFNRCNLLDSFLSYHLPIAKKYGVQVLISDNGSTDDTKEVLKKWCYKFSNIKVVSLVVNIGPERNFENALKKSDGKYVWLVGDTYRVPEKGIMYILEDFDEPEFYVFNLTGRLSLESNVYKDNNNLLSELGGLMSCLSCLVFKNDIVNKLDFERYYDSWFMHTGIVLDFFSRGRSSLKWIRDISVESFGYSSLNKKNWSQTDKVLFIAAKSWLNFVFSLPVSYPVEEKFKMGKAFNDVSGLFSLKGLLNLRSLGLLSFKEVYKYWYYLKCTSNYPLIFWVVVLVPVGILSLIKKRIFGKEM